MRLFSYARISSDTIVAVPATDLDPTDRGLWVLWPGEQTGVRANAVVPGWSLHRPIDELPVGTVFGWVELREASRTRD